ncbi:MAG: 2,3-bisphosphoglycerate-independent phosphoglycerate mutase [Candidatus Terrybacteria bacterium]|nr:2,3-bisphosphoglycerate-independent phosphoglycerate mutase [Candidatus Terrybacteria bacterium]
MKYKPVVLIILDGFGISPDKIGSPWEIVERKTFHDIEKFYPFTAIQASGIAVGLPWGEAGNSEVGHLTIGAGKIIYNYLPKISTAITDGSFFKNDAFLRAIEHVKKNNSSLHLSGLFSSGTVHAYFEHLYALLDLAKQNEVKNVYLHLYTDGKDAYKKEGMKFYKDFEQNLKKNYPNAKIASIIGRNFSMDRDNNWNKTARAYNLFVNGEGEEFECVSDYIASQYKKEIFDPNIEPAFAKATAGKPGIIKDNDALIFFNFREDSMRQLTRAFVSKDFSHFPRKSINNLLVVTMTEYDKNIPCLTAFKSAEVEEPLARIIAENGLKQLHIAESEKYAHVTYFLNGGRETSFEGEERILVKSPETPSYALVPEMSAEKVTEAVLDNLEKYDFIVVNFANADMVGHTGKFEPTAKAIETIDRCLGKIIPAVLKINGVMVITADHGNAEEKIYKITGEEKSKHSINPVPLYLIATDFKRKKEETEKEIIDDYKDIKGTLSDVAPTILELLGLKKPASMTGKNLLEKLLSS